MKKESRLIGREYGFLKVIRVPKTKPGEPIKAYCRCVCGNKVTRSVAYLRSSTAHIKSCGCSTVRTDESGGYCADVNFDVKIQNFYLGRKAS